MPALATTGQAVLTRQHGGCSVLGRKQPAEVKDCCHERRRIGHDPFDEELDAAKLTAIELVRPRQAGRSLELELPVVDESPSARFDCHCIERASQAQASMATNNFSIRISLFA